MKDNAINHLKEQAKKKLKREIRKQVANHFAGFWWVYAILLGILLIFYFFAVIISSNTSLVSSTVLSEKFLPPQIYKHDLEDIITDGFGERVDPVNGGDEFHAGVDIGVPIGTPVTAAQDGTVKTVYFPKTSDPPNAKSAGINVAIESKDEDIPGITRYLHMSNAFVTPGQTVKKGQIIGLSGNTGKSTGPHLHFELHPNGGDPVDPTPFILFMSKVTDVASEAALGAFGDVNFSEMNGYDYRTNPMLYISNVYIETAPPRFSESGMIYTRDMNTGSVIGSGGGAGGGGGNGPAIVVPTTVGVLHNPFFIKWAPYAMESEKRTGVKASVTLAQMALESGWGKSDICNNVFGIKANSAWKGPVCYAGTSEQDENGTSHINAGFRAYSSFADSFDDHAKFLLDNPRYGITLSKKNPFEWANELQRATYATDWQYANKLKTLMMNDNLMSLDRDRGIDPETGKPWEDVPYIATGSQSWQNNANPSTPTSSVTPSPKGPTGENTTESITITFGIEQLYGTYGRQVHRKQVKKQKTTSTGTSGSGTGTGSTTTGSGGKSGTGTGSSDSTDETEEQVTYTNLIDPYTGKPVINLEAYKNVIQSYSGELQAPSIYVKDLPDAIAVTLESSSGDDLRVSHVDFVKGQY
ncbi:glucosaminidase domain-containing protein [Cohnella soli]|uniref:Glucosaminidase domain-containing protein n=1 Tax=Cohnella soli TaxID=425005 RepID=A0ABW0HQG0_9BACL